MRPIPLLSTIIVLALTIPTGLSAEAANYGRDYVEHQRQLETIKKQLARDKRELKEFEELARQLDELSVPDQMGLYKLLIAQVRFAMEREHEQARVKLTEADPYAGRGEPDEGARSLKMDGEENHRSPGADAGRGDGDHLVYEMSMIERAERMRRIVGESGGLQYAIGAGELDAMPRFRYLVEEFLELMRADVWATQAALAGEKTARR